jgi:hypothetical protein
MLTDRRWRLLLVLFAAAFGAAPALAQQPFGSDSTTPPAAPAAKKSAKHKPPASAKTAEAASAVAGGAKPTLLKQFGDWGAYTASPGGKKVCFAIAKPATSETDPPGKSRNAPFMFISSRPSDKVTDEVSIIIGYPFKPNSEATVAIGSTSFALYTQQDGAWIKNSAEEANLIAAMRAGQNAVLKGTSARGTRSTDVFSLKGLAEAIDRSDQECK